MRHVGAAGRTGDRWRRVAGQAMALAALSAVGACTNDPGFVGAPGMRVAQASEVANCRYVTDLSGTPGVYGPLASEGLKYSRNQIMALARDSGADTVVFDKVEPGADVYQLHAIGYRCGA